MEFNFKMGPLVFRWSNKWLLFLHSSSWEHSNLNDGKPCNAFRWSSILDRISKMATTKNKEMEKEGKQCLKNVDVEEVPPDSVKAFIP